MAKVDAILAQREALVKEVQRVQAGMAAQEERMRAALEEMQASGRGMGRAPRRRVACAADRDVV